ncbi:outer membrane protein assembly factor BamA [Altererythrobacter sp. CAU 1778]
MSNFSISTSGRNISRATALLLAGTCFAGVPGAALAQDTAAEPASPTTTSLDQQQVIRTISVAGAQRLEPQTILSYIKLRTGQVYTQAAGDQALKDLAETELFSDYTIRFNDGNLVIEVVENPVVNRIILEGNQRIKNDKILPEIKLAPRQIFTRSKVRADVARIIELYKRQGRFAAVVEPNMVMLDQNRVDIVYEISEGPKSKVRQINILGNEAFSDNELKGEMVTKESGGLLTIFSSNTSYDPDRLAFDQQKLRLFYLTEGYADFRVVSAVAELTPDKEDFIITYVVEEGERYKFGDVTAESLIRDFDSERLTASLPMKTGDWYDAKLVEDTVEQMTETAGTFGYAFADVSPEFLPNRESKTMDVRFVMNEAPRVYVEQIDVNGNTLTQDKVVRREFRIAEGDAFNSLSVKRSTNRINSLGYFQENFEIEQKPGSQLDRILLEANVEEKPTGELQLSAGFSSLESFILQASIRQRNFRGRGQTVGASVNWSRFSRSGTISFFEPYVFDKNFSAGFDIYRRDYNNGFFNRDNATYEQATTGAQLRGAVPLSEYMSLIGKYTFNYDQITIDEGRFFSDFDGDGVQECEPLIAGRYICEALGNRTSSIVGLSLIYDTLNNRVRPTRGETVTVSTDFAGLGGNVRYARGRANAAKFWSLGSGFIFSLSAEGGYIKGLKDRGEGVDDVLLTDRFFLGEPQMRGFDIRGVGPRVLREFLTSDGEGGVTVADTQDDSLGGNAYYLGRAEVEIPLGSGARELGLRPSIFVDVGSLFNVTAPELNQSPLGNEIFIPTRNDDGVPLYFQDNDPDTRDDDVTLAIPDGGNVPTGAIALGQTLPAFRERFVGDSPKPRVSVGIGVNWNSPFGPFRIDFAQTLLKQEGDDTKRFSFNVGTQF